MSTPPPRPLLDTEKACLTMIKNWEAAIRERRLTIMVKVSPAAAEIIAHYDGIRFRIMRTEYKAGANEYHLTFWLKDYRRYYLWVMSRAGLRLEVDGSVTTQDNLKISNNYLGSELETNK